VFAKGEARYLRLIDSKSRSSPADASLGLAQQSRQRSLPIQERETAQVLAIMLDQVEGVE
jgi:hypothetical protein